MSLWEKTILNLQKGAEKFTSTAAVFSDRIKVELHIVRVKMRMDAVQDRIDELHRIIGRTVVELNKKSVLPESGEQLLQNDVIAAAIAELAAREKELEDLAAEIKSEQAAFKPEPKHTGDTIV